MAALASRLHTATGPGLDWVTEKTGEETFQSPSEDLDGGPT